MKLWVILLALFSFHESFSQITRQVKVEYSSGDFSKLKYATRIALSQSDQRCFAKVNTQKVRKRNRLLRFLISYRAAQTNEKSTETSFQLECTKLADVFSAISALPVSTDTSVHIVYHPSVLTLAMTNSGETVTREILLPRFNPDEKKQLARIANCRGNF